MLSKKKHILIMELQVSGFIIRPKHQTKVFLQSGSGIYHIFQWIYCCG